MSAVFDPTQRAILDSIARKQLETAGLVSGRSLRMSSTHADPAAIDATLASLVPRYLERSDGPRGDLYSVTVEGLLQSDQRTRSVDAITGIIAFFRRRLTENADFETYTWNEIKSALSVGDESYNFIRQLIHTVNLLHGGSESNGSPPHFEFRIPPDIEQLVRSSRLEPFLVQRDEKRRGEIAEVMSRFSQEPQSAPDWLGWTLQLINQFGMAVERRPSLYRGKNEEDLRDQFLALLTPHFESVTAESVNKAGKTDILVRHAQENLLVIECKFWRGRQAFLRAIDQALSYLTWRDTSAAILCFIKNQSPERVLDEIGVAAKKHAALTGPVGSRDRMFAFKLRLPNDKVGSVRFAVACFHVPGGISRARRKTSGKKARRGR